MCGRPSRWPGGANRLQPRRPGSDRALASRRPRPDMLYLGRPRWAPMSDNPSSRQGHEAAPDATPVPPAAAAVATYTPTVGHRAPASGSALAKLALGALGVVYGDIGTSPLYALKECFTGQHGVPATPANVLGVLSLVFWAMTFVVTFKYLSFVMRADNRGEGGILALLALAREARDPPARQADASSSLGLFGAALLYGDGVITPAISVLGAVEGAHGRGARARALGRADRRRASSSLLFLIQRRGTAAVGAVFGPVMLVWFVCIAILGVRGILFDASVLQAVIPAHAVAFFARNALARLPRPRRRRPRHHRRRGALRRHGPLREAPDPRGLARRRHAGAAPQLHRAGRAAPPRSLGGAKPVLPARARVGALPDDRHRDRSPRSSPRRPSSPARSRSRGRRCSSGTRRASPSGTPPRRRSARSTCRR